MKPIPKHCIKKFKELYVHHPSVLEVLPNPYAKDKIQTFFSKSRIVWRREYTNSSCIDFIQKKLLDYDPSGIMVYIQNDYHIFILTTEDRMDVAKLTLSRIKKIIKENIQKE